MPVEKDGRSTVRRRDLAEHDGRGVGKVERVDPLDAGALEELDHEVARGNELRVRLRWIARGGDGGNRDEARQIRSELGHQSNHAIARVVVGRHSTSLEHRRR